MSKFKNFFKSAFGKVAMVIGVGALAGGVGAYKHYFTGYEAAVKIWEVPFDRVAFFGDSGKAGAVREQMSALLDKYQPAFIVGMGDFEYDTGVKNLAGFLANIKQPFWRPGINFLAVGGNHDQYPLEERDFLLKLGRFDVRFPWFHYRNYWALHVFPNACLLLVDTAVWDIKVKKEVKGEQLEFIAEAVKDKRCEHKANFLGAHHPIYSPGESHGDRATEKHAGVLAYGPNDPWIKAFKKYVRGWAHFAVFGHEHINAIERCESASGDVFMAGPWGDQPILKGVYLERLEWPAKATCHVIAGASSKFNKCVRGGAISASGGCNADAPGFFWFAGGKTDFILPSGSVRDK